MLHSTGLFWRLCSCLRSTDHLFPFLELLELWSRQVQPTRRLSLLVPLPTTPESSISQRLLWPLYDLLLAPGPRSSKLVVNASLWINWLSELPRVKILWFWEVQETPEKLLDISVWVHTRVKPQESYLLVENSKELEVEEDLRVSRCNPACFENSGSFIFSFFLLSVYIRLENRIFPHHMAD